MNWYQLKKYTTLYKNLSALTFTNINLFRILFEYSNLDVQYL